MLVSHCAVRFYMTHGVHYIITFVVVLFFIGLRSVMLFNVDVFLFLPFKYFPASFKVLTFYAPI